MNVYKKLKERLRMKYSPVGIKLIFEGQDFDDKHFKAMKTKQRICEYIKRAAKGEFLKIEEKNTSCFSTGKSESLKVSENIELDMKLNIRGLKYLLLFPLTSQELEEMDSLILIITPKMGTSIIETYVELYKMPLKLTVGARSGVCSEIIAYTIKRENLNFSFLCNGARKYGEFDECELLCGIPAKMAKEIVEKLII
ncbi:MAG: hypothetical protein EU539_12600 [Promethearchaeota archaeon]|nr:MAG: hypothetical protein EU539_12600 [Candidatus Lokiarchaeota archaeon]